MGTRIKVYSIKAVIVDHTAVTKFNEIPQYYIDQIKTMLVSFVGESHAYAFRNGFNLVQAHDEGYAANTTPFQWPELVPSGPTDQYVRVYSRFWDGNTIRNGAGEQHTWTSMQAIQMVNDHLQWSRDLGTPFEVFMWGWCWDAIANPYPMGEADPVYGVRWYGRSYLLDGTNLGAWGLDEEDSILTGNAVCLQTYLNAFQGFQTNNPDVTVVYTTGPVDDPEVGGSNVGESGYQRYLKHEYIREWVRTQGGFLFDWADILTHNPSGQQTLGVWNGHSFPICYPPYDAAGRGYNESHLSEEANLVLGKALWVLLARVKGWSPAE